jgi:hypothetical protein
MIIRAETLVGDSLSEISPAHYIPDEPEVTAPIGPEANVKEPGGATLVPAISPGAFEQAQVDHILRVAKGPLGLRDEKIQVLRSALKFGYSRPDRGNLAQGTYAVTAAIQEGRLLHELRKLVGKSRWAHWAKEELHFIDRRHRQTCLLLGERTDCHPYAELGEEALLSLIDRSKSIDSPNPVADYLEAHGISVDPEVDPASRETLEKIRNCLSQEVTNGK